ncbi:hypothetical protein ACIBQ0_26010 [Nocardia nova]|uniref:hypothetical protein n=1 Tax=Nocardia nova TaxID=37330 RepID=UPI0037A635C0
MTIEIDANATARYRDFDPGPEPERIIPAFRTVHDVLTRWLTTSGFTEPDTAGAPLQTSARTRAMPEQTTRTPWDRA